MCFIFLCCLFSNLWIFNLIFFIRNPLYLKHCICVLITFIFLIILAFCLINCYQDFLFLCLFCKWFLDIFIQVYLTCMIIKIAIILVFTFHFIIRYCFINQIISSPFNYLNFPLHQHQQSNPTMTQTTTAHHQPISVRSMKQNCLFILINLDQWLPISFSLILIQYH